MRRIFLFVLFCFLLCVVDVSSSDRYNYLLFDESYDLYSISISNLNTNNFMSYFDGINVIRVYPKVNPIYKSMIGDISYKFSSKDLNGEINFFVDNYLSLIKKNSYSDYNYLYINGISIDRVLIYISGSDLYDFLNKAGGVIN